MTGAMKGMVQGTLLEHTSPTGDPIHPLAKVFPRATEEDASAIEKSMQRVGFRPDRPIVLLDGQILDGVNRYNAALKLGMQPLFKNYDSPLDPKDYVLSENRDRRHLNSGQKAAIAIELGIYEEEVRKAKAREENGKASDPSAATALGSKSGKAAEATAKKVGGTSERTVERVAYLHEHAPEEAEAVRRGEASASQAYEAQKAKEQYPVTGKYPRKERIKIKKSLDALVEGDRQEKLDQLKAGDSDTLALLTGRPPVPPGPTPAQKAKNDPGVKFLDAIHKIYEEAASVDHNGGIGPLIRNWSQERKGEYYREVKKLRLILSSWEEVLEMEIEPNA